MTPKQKSRLLNQAVDLLEQAELLVQAALRDTDVGTDTQRRIEEIKDDLITDIVEFDHAQPV